MTVVAIMAGLLPIMWSHGTGASVMQRIAAPMIGGMVTSTLLLSRGEHPKIVGERLGHSSTTLTLDTYSHVLPDMQEQAAVRLEETLFS